MKTLYAVVGIALVFLTSTYIYLKRDMSNISVVQISNFNDCVSAGNLVMESYPRRCRTKDGRNFIEEIPEKITEEIKEKITYTNSNPELIQVELPNPGAVTGKEFSIIGRARGTWYFEASFPVKVLDKEGQVLFEGGAQALSEWMTEDFVPFKIEVKVKESYIGPATVILNKDNPSGEKERDASISFPIIIEY